MLDKDTDPRFKWSGISPQLFIDKETGILGALELADLSFSPKRIYWITDFQPGAVRGQHAHKTLNQIFFVLNGSLEIDLYWGKSMETVALTTRSQLLVVGPGVWRVMRNASPGTVLVVLADQPYEELDYIRDWADYLAWYGNNQ